jgi:hypothetical protein
MFLVGLGKRPSSRRSASLVAVEYGGCGCAVEVGMGGYGWDSSIFWLFLFTFYAVLTFLTGLTGCFQKKKLD